jgi:hypothetical protein
MPCGKTKSSRMSGAREELSARFDFDVKAIFAGIRNRQAALGGRLVSRKKRAEPEPELVSVHISIGTGTGVSREPGTDGTSDGTSVS